jgi:hypothetical protein
MRPGAFNLSVWCRNINLPSIDYAFGPRLRVRLTLGGFTFPRKPTAFGERDSHPFYRYSFRHDHSQNLQGSLSVPLRRLLRRSPTVGQAVSDQLSAFSQTDPVWLLLMVGWQSASALGPLG